MELYCSRCFSRVPPVSTLGTLDGVAFKTVCACTCLFELPTVCVFASEVIYSSTTPAVFLCSMSVLVHPDKVASEEAREAFEALNEAHRILKDPAQLVCRMRALVSMNC